MDLITIEGLRLRCVIGCKAEERRDRSDVIAQSVVRAPGRGAGQAPAAGVVVWPWWCR